MTETFPLYNGELLLEFVSTGKRHDYYVVNKGRRYKVPSVTKITGIVDKSGPLVNWAINNTLDVIKGAIGPGAEYSEAYLEAVYKAAKGQSRGIKEDAASNGKQVHQWIERYIRGEQPVLPADCTPVRGGVDAFLQWMGEHKVQFLEVERPIYSRRHRYSGRMDGLAYVDDALAVVDWKTSNGVYVEYILQVAAYAVAYFEETGREVAKAILIRLDKETGIPEPHEFDRQTLKRGKAGFIAALQLWRALEKLKRAI